MDSLKLTAEAVATLLKARGEKLVVVESAAGGLISSTLLALPGASAFFLGGAVIYTRWSRIAFLGIEDEEMAGMRASTEDYAGLLARTALARCKADWAVAETGAAGPTGNRYGDDAGHACFAVAGKYDAATTLETAESDRSHNMRAFAVGALDLLAATIREA